MTANDLFDARITLGLSLADLATALQLRENGARLVRRWENGEQPISGPAAAAIELMLVLRKARMEQRHGTASIVV